MSRMIPTNMASSRGRTPLAAMPAAFSIVELLVVIGIIGILIALLLPTLANARKQSRAVACKAQLQHIGSAFQMYLNENDGWYPPAIYSPTFNPNGLGQVNDYLSRYVQDNKRIWGCPSDEKYFKEYGLSYSYYQELGVVRIQQTYFYKVLRSSSLVPVLWDADAAFHWGSVPFNWLFADGHVDHFLDEPKDAPDPPTQ
jgi:prepilin-type processing-associated H-X9-DG protein